MTHDQALEQIRNITQSLELDNLDGTFAANLELQDDVNLSLWYDEAGDLNLHAYRRGCQIHYTCATVEAYSQEFKDEVKALLEHGATNAADWLADARDALQPATITKVQFLAYYHSEAYHQDLTPDEKIEVFSQALHGSSDITYALLESVCADYDVSLNDLVQNQGA